MADAYVGYGTAPKSFERYTRSSLPNQIVLWKSSNTRRISDSSSSSSSGDSSKSCSNKQQLR